MSRPSREPQSGPAVMAPAPIDVRVATAAGRDTASVGGVPLTAPEGEEIKHAVLAHLRRIAVATGHAVLATIHDERSGYVVPLRIAPDGSSILTAEPTPIPTPPAPAGDTHAPHADASPSATPAPEPASDAYADEAPFPAPGTVTPPTGVFGPPPVMEHAEALGRPGGEGHPGLHERPEFEGRSEPLGRPGDGGHPGSGALPESEARPESDERPGSEARPESAARPGREEPPAFPEVPESPEWPEPENSPEHPYDAPEPSAPSPVLDIRPQPVPLDAPPSRPTRAPLLDPATAIPEPSPKHTPARGFDAVAEAVLGDDPREADGVEPGPLAGPMARINEAVRAGRIDVAAGLAEQTVSEASAALGADHPEVLRLRELAAYIAYLAGDPVRAFHVSLDVARAHHRAGDPEAAYGNVQSAATSWRAVRDPLQGLNLGNELLGLWTTLATEGGPAAEDPAALDSARSRMLRLAERAAAVR
ncbi:tetratricopeptide repeat protein [Streptomyces sp. 4F14]|uniref:tetratricopeptide repeat protein n=1 Tax=Streptomyces sp. 4F14 TaxID=3394380 RepID=UPI003A88F211